MKGRFGVLFELTFPRENFRVRRINVVGRLPDITTNSHD